MAKTFENREFSIRRRGYFCQVRNAYCAFVESICDTCICNRGSVYDSDVDSCEIPPATTTAAAHSTKTTTTYKQLTTKSNFTTSAKTSEASHRATNITTTATTSTANQTSTTPDVISLNSTQNTLHKLPTSSVIASSTETTTTERKIYEPSTTTKVSEVASKQNRFEKVLTTSLPNKASTKAKKFPQPGLIAGIVFGIIAIIICIIIIIIYVKKKEKKRNKSRYRVPDSSLQAHFSDIETNHDGDAPIPPDTFYAYAYSDVNSIKQGKAQVSNNSTAMEQTSGNSAKIISEPFYHVTDVDGNKQDPFYVDVQNDEIQSTIDNQIAQPIYQELSLPDCQPHLHNETPDDGNALEDKSKGISACVARNENGFNQYQELIYATNPHLYQPLSDDWKKSKYN